jgi:iron complex transport system ATP-binding protein
MFTWISAPVDGTVFGEPWVPLRAGVRCSVVNSGFIGEGCLQSPKVKIVNGWFFSEFKRDPRRHDWPDIWWELPKKVHEPSVTHFYDLFVLTPDDPAPIVHLPAVHLTNVRLSHDGGHSWALDGLSLCVNSHDRWAVLGANGSGKSTLVQIITGWLHTSHGDVQILGARLGQGVDWRVHRQRVGVVSAAFAKLLRPDLASQDVVMTAMYAALEPWWHDYSDTDRKRAYDLLADAGFGYLAQRPFGALSEGERQQVQLARTLMGNPDLLVLDEPAAGLDLGARERLVGRLNELASASSPMPIVLVTHHLEEIPVGFTHALLLSNGKAIAQGPIAEVLTSENVSSAFGIDVKVGQRNGRWSVG